MDKSKQRTEDDPEQSKRFIDAAREAEADETEEAAERAFNKVTSNKKKLDD
jgi:hypothetical protein